MRIRLLGTAAAEGWPGLFCRCAACAQARALGGKNLRSRSGATVDGGFQFDLGPDAYLHLLAGHTDLAGMEHLLVTHSHEDHLAPATLGMRQEPFAHGLSAPLTVYGNETVVARLLAAYPDPAAIGMRLETVRPFQSFAAGDATVIPLLADHDPHEVCLLYLFGRGGRWLLYGHDSGWFPEPTWDYLAAWAVQHHRLDVALLDCTHGPEPGQRNHMGLDAAARVRDRLVAIGAAGHPTRAVVTHFSHNGGLLHEALVARAAPMGLEVAYDGLEIVVD